MAPPVAPPPALPAGDLYRRWRARDGGRGTGERALDRARGMFRGGRSVLLWAVALFAVTQAGLFVALDRWHPGRVNVWRDKRDRLRELAASEPDRPLLVMIGSSRTDSAFQAGRFNGLRTPEGGSLRAYNFGAPAGGPIHEVLYLREMLDAGIRPRLLLIEFLPVLMNAPRRYHNSEEDWTSSPWLTLSQYLHIRPYLAHAPTADFHWIESRLTPGYGFRYYLQDWLLGQLAPGAGEASPQPRDAWGYRQSEVPVPGEYAYWLMTAWNMHGQSLQHFRLGKGPARAMRDLLSCCRREGIPVALVLMPESNLFRSWYAPGALESALAFLDELRREFRVDVIDASHWIPDDEFLDSHHVLAEGADRFTTRLRPHVRRLLARSAAPPRPNPAR